MQKAIRRESTQEEMRKHQDRVRGAWKKISKQTRQVNISCDLSMVTAVRSGTWMDEESFKKTCIKEEKKSAGIHQPAFTRHMGSGLHAETGCRKVYAGEVFE